MSPVVICITMDEYTQPQSYSYLLNTCLKKGRNMSNVAIHCIPLYLNTGAVVVTHIVTKQTISLENFTRNSQREERKPTRCNNIDDLLSIVDVDY